MKLKYKEIKELRLELLASQAGLCALCSEPIHDDAVLDHDHATGQIRCVLHRGCNALLGKIENNMARNRVDLTRLESFSRNLTKYLTQKPVGLFLHPTYKTPEERKMGRGRGRGKKPPKR